MYLGFSILFIIEICDKNVKKFFSKSDDKMKGYEFKPQILKFNIIIIR